MSESKAIVMFVHCRTCAERRQTPARIEVGITPAGIQVWCTRHDIEVATFTPAGLEKERARVAAGETFCDACRSGVPHQHST